MTTIERATDTAPMNPIADVIVVGAGPAGLAVAAEVGRLGGHAVVLERAAELGARFRSQASNRLNSDPITSRLPRFRPIGAQLLAFPSFGDYARYLDAFAQAEQLQVVTSCEVTAVKCDRDGVVLTTSTGSVIRAGAAVMATGARSSPRTVDWPSRCTYTGALMHSSEFDRELVRRPSRVIVVGSGSSAMEVCAELLRARARITLAVRSPRALVARRSAGIPTSLLAALRHRFTRGSTTGPAIVGWRLSAEGLDRPVTPTPPAVHAPAVASRPVIAALRSGAISTVGTIVDLWPNGVELADGSRLPADVVVAATGWESSLGRLADRQSDRVLHAGFHSDAGTLRGIRLEAPALARRAVAAARAVTDRKDGR